MKNVISYLPGREPIVLIALLLIAVGAWGFTWLSAEVFEGSTGSFDRWAVLAMRNPHDLTQPIGPPWLAEVGRDVTAIGSVTMIGITILAAAGFLTVNRNYRRMLVLLISTTSGMGLSVFLKSAFDRPRPDIVPHLTQVYTSSFPSGHSMMSAVVYLTLAVLIAPVLQKFWLRFYIYALASSVTILVGLSRIYLGVHYPTDVLAGWAAGLVWALACWMLDRITKTAVSTNDPAVNLKSSLPQNLAG